MNIIELEKLTDEELIFLALHHKEAYEEIVHRFQNKIYNFVLRYAHEEAEDLTQEIFVKAYFALPSFNQKNKFSTWLYALARNHCIDELRKHKIEQISLEQTKLDQVIADKQNNPSQEMYKIDQKEIMEKAIAQLQPDYREVIILFYLNELSYQEISEILKKPLGTIKTQLSRAKKVLETILAPYKEVSS